MAASWPVSVRHANTGGWSSGVPGHPALGVVPIVAGALTLVAAVFLIVAALSGPRRAGRRAYTAVPLALGVALVGWVVLLVATRSEPAGLPARLTRTGLAVLVGYLPGLLLALLAYSAIRGRIGPRGRTDVVVVLGSLGNPLGTALGGIVYGVSYMLVQTYLSSWADLLPYVLLIAILLLRPSGLLGRRVRVA